MTFATHLQNNTAILRNGATGDAWSTVRHPPPSAISLDEYYKATIPSAAPDSETPVALLITITRSSTPPPNCHHNIPLFPGIGDRPVGADRSALPCLAATVAATGATSDYREAVYSATALLAAKSPRGKSNV
jgi:hypothetical protein